MNTAFYIAAAVAVSATVMAITRAHVVHALLYVIVSLLAVAACLFALGAHFAAALEVIIYAGAIMVLFVFAVMMLDPVVGKGGFDSQWLRLSAWAGPAALSAVLLTEMVIALGNPGRPAMQAVGPEDVGMSLMRPYVVGMELASMLLLAGLIGAYHLGRRPARRPGGREGR